MARRSVWAALGLGAAGAGCAVAWGFTVDDALISVRYARHLASGLGWRMNAGGPPSDGVTPLWWPVVLAPFARADALTVLSRARGLGMVLWLAAAAALGVRVGRAASSPYAKGVGLLVLGLCFPVAAHATAGMETGLVLALATAAALAFEARPASSAGLAGLAASLRPEMIPWAGAMALASARAARLGRARSVLVLALALGPAIIVAFVRLAAFGRPAPLAVLAKPSDLSHGLAYAIAASLACLTPVLACAPVALWRARGAARGLALAGAVHGVAVVAAGGDWMPYARLVVPIAPSLVLAFVLSAPHARAWSTLLRSALALGLGVWLLATAAPAGRAVVADRAALVRAAAPTLAGAKKVACLDVGWVSAATDADLVDLAGLTDLEIAVLPGGHTSKHVDVGMLIDRHVDRVILYVGRPEAKGAPWPTFYFPRVVEARLARDPLLAAHFGAPVLVPLGTRATYVVLSAVPGAGAGLGRTPE